MIVSQVLLWFTFSQDAVARCLRSGVPIATPLREEDMTGECESLNHDLVEQHLAWLAGSKYARHEFDRDAYRSYLLNLGTAPH